MNLCHNLFSDWTGPSSWDINDHFFTVHCVEVLQHIVATLRHNITIIYTSRSTNPYHGMHWTAAATFFNGTVNQKWKRPGFAKEKVLKVWTMKTFKLNPARDHFDIQSTNHPPLLTTALLMNVFSLTCGKGITYLYTWMTIKLDEKITLWLAVMLLCQPL